MANKDSDWEIKMTKRYYVASTLYVLSHLCLQNYYELDMVLIPMFTDEELRYSEYKDLAQDYIVRE